MGADTSRGYYLTLGLITLFGAVVALLWLPTFAVGSFFDDARYVILAEALGSGRGYHLIHLPSAPPEPAFPPGWPLLLAPLASLVDGRYLPLQLVAILLALLAIPLIARLSRPRLGREAALAVSALVGVNPWLIASSSRLMSESAYIGVSLLALALFTTGRRRTVAPLLLALLAAMIRSTGWTLVAALGMGALVRVGRRRDRRRPVLALGGLGTIAAAVFLAYESAPLPPLYREHLAFVAPRIADYLLPWRATAPVDPQSIATLLLPIFDLRLIARLLPAPLTDGLAIGLLGTALLGLFVALRRPTVVELYVFLYTLLIAVWTGYIAEFQPRQLLPVLPMYTLYLLLGARTLLAPLTSGRDRAVALRVVALGLLVGMGVRDAHELTNPLRERISDLEAGTALIRARAPADAIVMTADPAPDYLYLRRRTLEYPAASTDIESYLEATGVDYVVLRPSLGIDGVAVVPRDPDRERLRGVLEADPTRYRLIAREGEVAIYEVAE